MAKPPTYEATDELSEILKRVAKGDTVTITRKGKPVAEVRPIQKANEQLRRRIEELRRRGVISPPGEKGPFKPLAKRPGALKRFLDDRE